MIVSAQIGQLLVPASAGPAAGDVTAVSAGQDGAMVVAMSTLTG
jgi:hypothetical protein